MLALIPIVLSDCTSESEDCNKGQALEYKLVAIALGVCVPIFGKTVLCRRSDTVHRVHSRPPGRLRELDLTVHGRDLVGGISRSQGSW
ncbi:VQ domain-containing protein [Psidium guajava]|nr:VQ domain-containing protein [Psidium guajava]